MIPTNPRADCMHNCKCHGPTMDAIFASCHPVRDANSGPLTNKASAPPSELIGPLTQLITIPL
ncbi:hypothetical protein DPMN_106132 [Dreissena polymorpha]|uniref:Uncharacterized protein n=1 Tax=Dreissena polymorpha TaxID=45954 RepID=A0A9D4K4E9_DREPO|nr:hypothetical protein DPMN_106056 [Dreissena polymorpha]KAH3832836.1 hypothetical protein DPMN_106132 [Dreissena polymorpha]